MTDLPPEPLPLPERIKSAEITLIVASASFDIWWTYANRDTRDLEAMNVLPTFFRYDQEAHFRNVVVSLHTLFDDYDRSPTLTIKSLIHALDVESAKPVWRVYRRVHDRVAKIRVLRHNVFAHRNAGMSYKDVFEEASLQPNDLKSLLDDTVTMLTMIADAAGAPTPTMSPFLTEETTKLLAKVKRRAI